jgi:hypothetical protein
MRYVTSIDGIILQVQYDTLINTSEATTAYVNMTGVRRLGKAAARARGHLPAWVDVVFAAPLNARIHSLSVLPQQRQFSAPPAVVATGEKQAQFWTNT